MLPTNRDENWRYANLRPLAKAKSEAVATPAAPHAPIALPAQLPDYERWVFVDGTFRGAVGSRREIPAPLCSMSAMPAKRSPRCSTRPSLPKASTLRSRVSTRARRIEVLHVVIPDGARRQPGIGFRRQLPPRPAGTSYPRVQVHAGRSAQVRIVERHVSAGSADSAINAAFDLALRADASIDHCRLQKRQRRGELLRHVDRARR